MQVRFIDLRSSASISGRSFLRYKISNTAKALLGSGLAMWLTAAIGYHYWHSDGERRAGTVDAANQWSFYHVPLWLRLVTIAAIVLMIAGAVALIPGGSEVPEQRK